MAGTITFPNAVSWLPPSWLFDNVMEQALEVIDKVSNPRLVQIISDEIESSRFLQIEKMTVAERQELTRATREVLRRRLAAEPAKAVDPADYEAYLRELERFVRLLEKSC
jgi:hypothetical protein